MPIIEVNGARVAYAETGSGETVVLLHATAGSGAQWRALTEILRSDFRVLAPDLYGYGETDPWPGHAAFALAEEAALVDAVLRLRRAPIHFVGHSYGAAVALRFALEQPERVRSMVLIEPVALHLLRQGGSVPADGQLLAEVMEVAALVSDGVASGDYRAAMGRFVDYWSGAGAWLRMKPELQGALARRIPQVALDFWAATTEPTPRSAYRRIAAPTLVLRGGRSPRPARRIAELVAGSLPAGRLETVEGAGHMLPLTHAEIVNAAIAEHLMPGMAAQRPLAAVSTSR